VDRLKNMLWLFVHQAIAHPIMLALPAELGCRFHDWTAARAFPATAACVVVLDDGRVLCVARRGTADGWGLPGGSVEPNETPAEAAVRECLEETRVVSVGLREVYRGVVGSDIVVTYLARSHRGTAAAGDSGPVKWLSWEPLISPSAPFREYNSRVLYSLRRKTQ
jgi:8-oxo-dGTP pyrophosphatase MutT (NUDIX family)